MLDNFYAVYTPDENRFRVGDSVLDKYAKLVPKELMYLWKKDGFGLYNKGLFQTIDPEDYRFVLELWLGKKMDNYTPFAQTAFGEVGRQQELYNPLQGEQAITQQEAIGAATGTDQAAKQRVESRKRQRQAAFAGGGSFATSQTGMSGLAEG